MLEDWYRQIRLRVPFEQWQALPPFVGYKSEYIDGEAVWTPRPKSYNAVLDLSSDTGTEAGPASDDVSVRAVDPADWQVLPPLLAGAFDRIPPFCALDAAARVQAAEDCLQHTRKGGDGEFLGEMSVVATRTTDGIVGALLVTRWDAEKPHGVDSRDAATSPLTDAHITWVFVRRLEQGNGIATAMLRSVVARLRSAGFTRLYTTFLRGNESSMLWHWRTGFRLLRYEGSFRTLRANR
jgi:GNAT superfamily N-acetyltransferase